jgi:dTDP-L-rhamnose 4-epimerase
MTVLITGGAGFIGRRLAQRLVALGMPVTVYDSLSEQVHGANADFPAQLLDLPGCRCVRADICDRDQLSLEVASSEIIVHLAAETGTGQSMYDICRYEHVNMHGTATLLEIIVNNRPRLLRKLIVASSRAVYGEGSYQCATHGIVHPKARSTEALAAARFEPQCPVCGSDVASLPTSEDAPFAPSSFYGLTKQTQEQMVLMFGATLGLDAFALRYQNVYGPGQSLSNPYTGLLAVFSNLVRQGKALSIFEDGLESRDFVYIDDVVEATALCAAGTASGIAALNVGSGVRTSVLDVAQAVRAYFQSNVPINVTGAFRAGDIRHNAADISRIRTMTGFVPKWSFQSGLREFLGWAQGQSVKDAGFERSLAELRQRGLMSEGGADGPA